MEVRHRVFTKHVCFFLRSQQVDDFLSEERRSIDEAEEYLVGRSALADRAGGSSATAKAVGVQDGGDSAFA